MKKQKNNGTVECPLEQEKRIHQTFKKEERKDIIGLVLTVIFFTALVVALAYGVWHILLRS